MMLAEWRAFDERKQAPAEHMSQLSRDDILSMLTQTERHKLYSRARQTFTRENTVVCADLKVWDEHRKRVVHKGKPVLDPNEDPGEDASDLARQLDKRRCELAALQAAAPAAFAAEKKRELGSVRPRALELKQQLAAEGAYRLGAFDIEAIWRSRRDLPREEGGSPLWPEVTVGAMVCGFDRAERAWKNWMSSAAGTRAGRRMGVSRFKKKGHAKDSLLPERT
ncbi:hypothetical protein [Streptomyces syringium]|uniref:hypothetical protein n=1 Tax=Streptomyces syringium TaxID=76729 RepID=UPI0033DA6206